MNTDPCTCDHCAACPLCKSYCDGKETAAHESPREKGTTV